MTQQGAEILFGLGCGEGQHEQILDKI